MTLQGQTGYLFTNWAKTFSCQPELFFEPESVDELREVIFSKLLKFDIANKSKS